MSAIGNRQGFLIFRKTFYSLAQNIIKDSGAYKIQAQYKKITKDYFKYN